MALLDQWGRPVQISRLTKPQAEPTMTGVRQIWHGAVAAGLTPARLAGILRASDEGDLVEFLTLAEEMEERDLHYSSVLGIRKRVVSGITPHVVAASEDTKDEKIADAVRKHIAEHDDWADLIKDLLDAIGKGFSVVEINWDRGTSLWTPKSFDWRPAQHFTFDRRTGRTLRLRDEADPVHGVELQPFRFITHMPKSKSGAPHRSGVARLAAFSWMCKSYTLKDWMAFVETYGLPLRLGRYGPGATPKDVVKLMQAVANIGTDAAAVLPDSMRIEFENGPAANSDKVFENLARYIDEQVSKGVLGQTMTSDNGSSLAQAQVHNDVRLDIALDDARSVSGAINRALVRPFVDLNFGVQQAYPKIEILVVEPEDTKAKIDGAAILLDRGVHLLESELRAAGGWSEPKEGDAVVGGVRPATSGAGDKAVASNRIALNAQVTQVGAQSPASGLMAAVEAQIDTDWAELGLEMQAAIAQVMDRAESYAELLEMLPEALNFMPTGKAVEALVIAMFKARSIGDQHDG